MWSYRTNDFTVGEASYNDQQNPRDCPQVGCTVFRYKKATRCVVDKLGGAVGTYFGDEMDVFSNEPDDCNKVDAICFSGGSVNGLIPSAGVAEALVKEYMANNVKEWEGNDAFYKMPVVKGAITFSGAWGKVPKWKPPDSQLGATALRNATDQTVHLGQYGAGSNAEVGSILTKDWGAKGGQGAYCATKKIKKKKATRKADKIHCAVYCNLNSKGVILDLNGKIMHGPRKDDGTFYGNQFRSTNILIHTNAKCKSMDLMRQLARQVHVSIARVITPYSAHSDGDVLFLTSSETVEVEDTTSLGVFFSECLWKAVHSLANHYAKPIVEEGSSVSVKLKM